MFDEASRAAEVVKQKAEALDDAVKPADEPGNSIMVDNARVVRFAGPLFALCAVVLVPWIVITSIVLPSRQVSENFDVAWSGYDVGLFVALASTAVCALRRSRYLTVAASAAGALLVADAWFDVVTAPGGWNLGQSIAMSVLVELPLASVCFWLSMHSQDVADQRIVLLARHRQDKSVTFS